MFLSRGTVYNSLKKSNTCLQNTQIIVKRNFWKSKANFNEKTDQNKEIYNVSRIDNKDADGKSSINSAIENVGENTENKKPTYNHISEIENQLILDEILSFTEDGKAKRVEKQSDRSEMPASSRNAEQELFDILSNTEEDELDLTEKIKSKLSDKTSNLVILNAQTAGVIKKIPHNFQKYQSKNETIFGKKASVSSSSSKSKKKSTILSDDTNEIQSSKSSIQKEVLNEMNCVDVLLDDLVNEKNDDLLIFSKKESDEQIFDSINELRPPSNIISHSDFKRLFDTIMTSYKRANLIDYCKTNFKSDKLPGSKVKKYYVNIILKDIWCLKPTSKKNLMKIKTKVFNSDEKINFFLFNKNSKILNKIRSNYVDLAISGTDKFVAKGTESRLQWFEAAFNFFLQGLSKEYVNFSELHKFLQANVCLDKIQDQDNVYFEKVGEDEYVLNSSSSVKLQKAKRLIVWDMNYNSREKNSVSRLSENLRYYEYNNSKSLPWIFRYNSWGRFRQPQVSKKFIPEKENELIKTVFTDAKIDELFDILNASKENGLISATFGEFLVNSRIKDYLNEKNGPNKFLNETKFIEKPYIFQTTLPSLKEQSIKNQLFYDTKDSQEVDTSILDNHTYLAQIKLVPNPYVRQSPNISETEVSNLQKYPPIEMWMEIDQRNEIQYDTLSVLAVSEEHNHYLSLSDKSSDLKLTNTISDIIYKLPVEEETDENDEGKPIFNWLDKKNDDVPSYFAKQPDVYRFLKDSRLFFGSDKGVHISKEVTINMKDSNGNTTPVNYIYVNSNYKRQLDFAYEDGYLLQFSTIQGGVLGGERIEVSLINYQKESRTVLDKETGSASMFVGDETLDQKKEKFRKYFRKVLKFVDSISNN